MSASLAPDPSERPSAWLRRQIEWRQFFLLTEQQRANTYAGLAVIAVTLVLAPTVAHGGLVAGIALLRLVLFVSDNLLARKLQAQLANDAPRPETIRKLVIRAGLANMTWGALTWPLVLTPTIDLMSFVLSLIALFSICLAIVFAGYHPHTLKAATAGGALGLAPKVVELSGLAGPIILIGFVIYLVTIYHFAQQLARQSRGGIALDFRRRRIADRLARSNAALQQALVAANRLADQDSLTRLRNRRAFEQAMAAMLSPQQDRAHCLMLIDVDHFKRINDQFGHGIGDGVLVALGTALNQWERDGPGRLAGRWGGEEFIALVAIDRPDQAGIVADELRNRISELADVLHWPGAIALSASIGCAPLHRLDQFDQALRGADSALYEAKRAGRNCWKLAA